MSKKRSTFNLKNFQLKNKVCFNLINNLVQIQDYGRFKRNNIFKDHLLFFIDHMRLEFFCNLIIAT